MVLQQNVVLSVGIFFIGAKKSQKQLSESFFFFFFDFEYVKNTIIEANRIFSVAGENQGIFLNYLLYSMVLDQNF